LFVGERRLEYRHDLVRCGVADLEVRLSNRGRRRTGVVEVRALLEAHVV